MPEWQRIADEERRRRQENAHRNFAAMVGGPLAEELSKSANAEQRPAEPADPLEVLGDLRPLELNPKEEAFARGLVAETLAEKGPEYVWNARVLLKSQLAILLRF